MAFEAVINMKITVGNRTVGATKVFSGDSHSSVDAEVTVASSPLDIIMAFDVSAVKAFLCQSTKDVTFTTWSTGGVAQVINLKANVPYIWCTDSYDTFKLTDDVIKIVIINASGATAQVKIEVVEDPTP